MKRGSDRLILAAASVAVAAMAIVAMYGITPLPSAPDLHSDGAPTIKGVVAYTEILTERERIGEQGGCLVLLQLASGDSQRIKCTPSLWLYRWDVSGYLVMNSGTPAGAEVLVDPQTGEVVPGTPASRTDAEVLYTYREGGRILLVFDDGAERRPLIDEECPETYKFVDAGVSSDGLWAWVVDSADRLLVVATDGAGGTWLVAEEVAYVAWQ